MSIRLKLPVNIALAFILLLTSTASLHAQAAESPTVISISKDAVQPFLVVPTSPEQTSPAPRANDSSTQFPATKSSPGTSERKPASHHSHWRQSNPMVDKTRGMAKDSRCPGTMEEIRFPVSTDRWNCFGRSLHKTTIRERS
jgi:hypothetical protein